MSIKISVVVPIYNVEKYLARCLDSLVKQTLKDIEIICINDGSLDNSNKIAQSYAKKDSRIILINQANKGLSAARNVGIDAARGKYISFVDSDDWIDLDFLEKLYIVAEKYNADATCASILRPHDSGKNPYKIKFEIEQILSSVTEKYRVLEIPRKCYVWNKIYKLDELKRQGLRFVEGVTYEDMYFTIRFLYYCKEIVTVPDTCYHYYVNRKSITRTATDKNQIDILAARADFIKFSREHHIKCNEKYYIREKITYSLFGVPFLRIHRWETIEKYYLFGLIPFFEKRIAL